MKTAAALLVSLVLILISIATFADEKYVPKPNEELYGTWINEQNGGDRFHPQKVIVTAEEYAGFSMVSDSTPIFSWKWWIDSKWTDSEGNIWYKVIGMGLGSYGGEKSQELYKLSKSGTVMERAINIPVREFDPTLFPTRIEPKSWTYRILFRAEK